LKNSIDYKKNESSRTLKFIAGKIMMKHELGLFFALAVLIITFSLLSEQFLTSSNLLTIANQMSMVFIISVGMTYVIILGGIDLSAGSVAGLAGMITAGVLSQGFGTPVGVLAGIAVGVAAGLFNGLMITKVGITDFIVTLSTMSIAHGFIYAYSGGYTIYKGIPKSFLIIGQGKLAGIPLPIILAGIIFIIGHLILSSSKFGTYVYATGGNKESSRLSGINVDRVRILVYIFGGIASAIAGIIMASRLGTGQPTAGDTFLFDSVGAVVLGGTSMSGGEGGILGTLIGVAIIGVISNGLTQLNVSFYYQEVIKGLIIVLSVAYNSYRIKASQH
jgi:ribose transport system permease protein